jgi:deoxyribodipyrimidine photo-lyase
MSFMMNSVDGNVNILWLRRDLRLYDNVALSNAMQSPYPIVPLFIFDTDILDELERPYDKRVEFIHRTILGVHEQLRAHGSGMLVQRGRPVDVFRTLMEKYTIGSVFANEDYEPYATRRDNEVAGFLAEHGVQLILSKDQVIRAKDEILTGSGTPFRVFTPYKNKWREMLQDTDLETCGGRPDFSRFGPVSGEPPSLESLGFRATETRFPEYDISEGFLRHYVRRRDIPAVEGTSRLGIHLRFGTVSIREVAEKAVENSDVLLDELIWREFFMMVLYHHPHVATGCFRPEFEAIRWRNNNEEFQLWCEGKTGYPLVDAGMRQLNETGSMHNRVRMVTAGFLVKDLLIDWRWGEAYFASKLLDYDMAANNGNWQWAAGTGCDAAPYFRVFHPETQRKKFDPDDIYCRRWIPELGTSDYPQPMVDHAEARQRALHAYKTALMSRK